MLSWKAIANNYINLGQHPFHMVDPSPWPIAISFSLYLFACTVNLFFNFGALSGTILVYSLSIVLLIMFCWIQDVLTESTFFGHHTKKVFKGLESGISYFIVSEFFLFVSIFWAFFHLSLTPSVFLGGSWPPIGLQNVESTLLPFVNTLILVFSGVSLTLAHGLLVTKTSTTSQASAFIGFLSKSLFNIQLRNFIKFNRLGTLKSIQKLSENPFNAHAYNFASFRLSIILEFLYLTLFLAVWFTYFQYVEYCGATFSINDTSLGTIFFFSTGFHGIHVIFGAAMIAIQTLLISQRKVFYDQLAGFEFATVYWHFVDIIWLGLFIVVYGWVEGDDVLRTINVDILLK